MSFEVTELQFQANANYGTWSKDFRTISIKKTSNLETWSDTKKLQFLDEIFFSFIINTITIWRLEERRYSHHSHNKF